MAARSSADVQPLTVYPANWLAWRLKRWPFIAGTLCALLTALWVVIAFGAVVVVYRIVWCAANVAGDKRTIFFSVRVDVRLGCGACNTGASSY